jgi:putative hydrolase of the HAD superfamily
VDRVSVRAVLVDVLGTLLELEPPGPALRAELLERTGVDVGGERAVAAIGAEISYYLAHHLEGRDMERVERLRDRCAEEIRRALAAAGEEEGRPPAGAERIDHATARAAMLAALRFRPYPDAQPALRELRSRGLRLVAASNWDASLAGALDRAGLAPHLDGAVSSAVVGTAKPHPAVFAAALELAGCTAAEAVHVGDSPEADVEGARRAGIRAVLLDRHGSLADPPGSVAKVASLAAVAPLICGA